MCRPTPGNPSDFVLVFVKVYGAGIEQRDWNQKVYGDPRSAVNIWVRAFAEVGDFHFPWAETRCRHCGTVFGRYKNPEYKGPIPSLRNPATELLCCVLNRTKDIKEQMKAKAEAGNLEDFIQFVTASLFPCWAEAGLRDRLAMIALDQVNWEEVPAALGAHDPQRRAD